MHWYERQPERWKAEQQIASQVLDGFCSGVDADGVAFVEGVFHVRSGHGHLYESVTIRVEYPHSFPERGQPPRVVLLSHRDRWDVCADAHIYSDWNLCLFVPGETPVDFSRADSLSGLFAVLHTFLFKEHLFQRALKRQIVTGVVPEWPGASRSHGRTGVAEAVREIGKVGRNEPCPCGSGRKFKVCCMRLIGR